jgi:protein-arginine kinase activator protein McsA
MRRTGNNWDIEFLQLRLDQLIEVEDYEKAAVIKRWIDELTVFYGEKNIKKGDLSEIRK